MFRLAALPLTCTAFSAQKGPARLHSPAPDRSETQNVFANGQIIARLMEMNSAPAHSFFPMVNICLYGPPRPCGAIAPGSTQPMRPDLASFAN